VRTVKTRSEAIAAQVVWSSRRGSRRIEHPDWIRGMMYRSWRRLRPRPGSGWCKGQGEFDLGLDPTGIAGAPLQIVGSRAGHLRDALCRGYEVLGLERAPGGDEVFRNPVLARIIERPARSTRCGCWLRPVCIINEPNEVSVSCRRSSFGVRCPGCPRVQELSCPCHNSHDNDTARVTTGHRETVCAGEAGLSRHVGADRAVGAHPQGGWPAMHSQRRIVG